MVGVAGVPNRAFTAYRNGPNGAIVVGTSKSGSVLHDVERAPEAEQAVAVDYVNCTIASSRPSRLVDDVAGQRDHTRTWSGAGS